MTRMRTRGFTLIELLLVIAIMGLLGTLSVNGFRSMRQGMEQSSVLRNASQFIRNAYQRAQIDRQPVAVFFWNEVRRDESDDGTETLLVVGRAVAVRKAGRISAISGNCLVDEFGNLDASVAMKTGSDGKEEYDDDAAKNGVKTYIYRMKGSGNWDDCKCWASQSTVCIANDGTCEPLLFSGADPENFTVYGYYVKEGVGEWSVGQAYGLEFADLTLPNNYIFGTTFPDSIKNSPKDANTSIWFEPGVASSETVVISAVRPGKGGKLEAKKLPDETENPSK